MVTGGVNALATNTKTSTTNATSSSDKNKTNLNFQNMFQSNLNVNQNRLNQNSDFKAKTSMKRVDKKVVNQNNSKANQLRNFRVNGKARENVVEANQETTTVNEDLQVAEFLTSAMEDLEEYMMNQFGLSKEEIEKALENLGITMVDLFDPNNLAQFFMEVKGVDDISSIITDGDLAKQLQDFMNQMQEVNPLTPLNLTLDSAKEILSTTTTSFDDAVKQENIDLNETNVEDTNTQDSTSTIKVEVKDNVGSKTSDSMGEKKNEAADENVNSEYMIHNVVSQDTENKVSFMDSLAPTSETKEIIDQIVQEIKVTIDTDKTTMEMVLKPESLGRINMSITNKSGVMTAHFVAETAVAKEAIESQINILKENLDAQGIKVEAVEVTIANYSFDADAQAQSSEQQAEAEKLMKKNARFRMVDEADIDGDESQDATRNSETSLGKGTQIDITA